MTLRRSEILEIQNTLTSLVAESEKAKAERSMTDLETKTAKQKVLELSQEIEKLRAKNLFLAAESNGLKEQLIFLEGQNEDAQQKQVTLLAKTFEQEVLALSQKNEELEKENEKVNAKELDDAKVKLLQAQDQLYLLNVERKSLHNMLLDGRGNIEVFPRVRSNIATEGGRAFCKWKFNDEFSIEVRINELVPSDEKASMTLKFAFDRTFGFGSSQEEIFNQVAPFVQSALDR